MATDDDKTLSDELKAQVCAAIDALVHEDKERSDLAFIAMQKRVQDLVDRKRRMEGSKTDTRDLVMELVFSRVRQAMQSFCSTDAARNPQRAAEQVMGSLWSLASLTEVARTFDQVLLRSSHGEHDFNFASRTDFLSLEEVLQMLAAGKHKGCLSLEKADNRLDVYMRDGRIVWLDPHHVSRRVIPASDSLRQRELTTASIEAAEAERTRTGRPVVLALADAGCFRGDETREMARRFGTESLFEFLMEDGPVAFYYRRHESLPQFADENDLRLGVTSVLLEGSKRVDDWRAMRRMFPDASAVLQPADDMFARMGDVALGVLELKLVSQANGSATPKSLVATLGLPLFDVYCMLVRLAREGILVAEHVEAAEGMPRLSVEESMQEAFAALDANDDKRAVTSALDSVLGDDPPRVAPSKRVARGTAASALDAVFDGMNAETKPASRTATKEPEKAVNPEQKDFLSILKRSRPDAD